MRLRLGDHCFGGPPYGCLPLSSVVSKLTSITTGTRGQLPTPAGLAQAEERIWNCIKPKLADGTIPITGVSKRDGLIIAIPQEVWSNPDLSYPSCVETISFQHEEELDFASPFVPEQSEPLLMMLIQQSGNNSHQRTSKSEADRGGRPPVYDLQAFLTEAFLIIHKDSVPPKNALDLRKRTRERFANSDGDTPSDKWAKPIIDKLWSDLHRE